MRPRLKDDAYFTRVDEGLVWLTPAGLLTVKEPSVAAMVERLAPRLNGRHTVDELTARLPERTRRLIVELLDVLVRQGLVEDARPGRTPTTSAEPDAAFVQQVTGDPDAALHRYRNGRALVMGPDPLLAHCVGALSASGVTTVETVARRGRYGAGTGRRRPRHRSRRYRLRAAPLRLHGPVARFCPRRCLRRS